MLQMKPGLACEFLAHWVGGISLPELGRMLGYTPRRLSDLIEDDQCRSNRRTVAYDCTTKRHQTTVASEKLRGPKTPSAVVTLLQAAWHWNDAAGRDLLCPVVDTREYRRQPAPDIFRTLLAACTRRQVVDLTYLAKSRQHSVMFSPHTLVVTTHRSHFRGFSHFEAQGEWHWWDLIPSRVLRAEIAPGSGYVGAEGDVEWHEQASLDLRIREAVTPTMRDMLRREHGLAGDALTVGPHRRALLPYVAADYLDRVYRGFNGPAWELVEGADAAVRDAGAMAAPTTI